MAKLMVMPSIKEIDNIIDKCDALLFGIKGYSVNVPCEISLDELKNISSSINKELFISLNKNIVNNDLDNLKELLKEIDLLNIKGIFYADPCFINLKKDLNLKTDLVWSNEHLTTNYATINFWQNYGIKYTYLSTDITLDEVKEIRKNTSCKLIMPIFGYLPMYVSFRHAVKNYLDYFDIKDNMKINYLEKEDKIYPIIDNELGTTVYSHSILDGYEEYKDLDIDYVTLNEFNIDRDTFIKVLDKYNGKDSNYILDTDKGFLYKETIYKVKK
ncbi:MAG TPA: U32 family peptidase [Bacilli bacterium]|nr:U32 family peptidase [Bacilli bacterium]